MRCFWNLINIAAERLSLHFNEAGDDEGSSCSSAIFLCYHRFISSRWCIHKRNKNWDLLALRPWHQNWDSTVCVKKYAMAQQTKITIMHLKLRFICAPLKRGPLSYERTHNFMLFFWVLGKWARFFSIPNESLGLQLYYERRVRDSFNSTQ